LPSKIKALSCLAISSEIFFGFMGEKISKFFSGPTSVFLYSPILLGLLCQLKKRGLGKR
jgi:hypothetical protein